MGWPHVQPMRQHLWSQTKPKPSQAELVRGCGLAWDPDSHRAVTVVVELYPS